MRDWTRGCAKSIWANFTAQKRWNRNEMFSDVLNGKRARQNWFEYNFFRKMISMNCIVKIFQFPCSARSDSFCVSRIIWGRAFHATQAHLWDKHQNRNRVEENSAPYLAEQKILEIVFSTAGKSRRFEKLIYLKSATVLLVWYLKYYRLPAASANSLKDSLGWISRTLNSSSYSQIWAVLDK